MICKVSFILFKKDVVDCDKVVHFCVLVHLLVSCLVLVALDVFFINFELFVAKIIEISDNLIK
jgi:hypothetical protein